MVSKKKTIKIDLDSNIFSDQEFVNLLVDNSDEFDVCISVIVYLETLFYYLTRFLNHDDFDQDLKDITAVIKSFDKPLAVLTAEKAIKSSLPFRHHARDFIIGSSAVERGAILLTNNIKHFQWLPEGTVMDPEEFIKEKIELFSK